MLPRANRDRTEYNRRVMNWLRKNAPYHAEELNSRGEERGWWDQLNYFRITYKTPEQAGYSIREIRLNDRAK